MNIETIKQTIEILKPNNQLYEIRILKGKQIISGYFKGTDNLEKALKTVDLRGANVFYTLQRIDDACYSREQHECFRQQVTNTSDADIVSYDWLLVDLDPVRRPGVSSTNEELEYAKETATRIYKYLQGLDFEEPIIAMSGNGVHLLYKVGLICNEDNKQLMSDCLKALDMLFTDDHVDIDLKVFNPARISKLYGTMAQKGASTEDRPHRLSRIVKCPNELKQTEKNILQNLVDVLPEEDLNPVKIKPKQEFDLDNWISQHGLRISKQNSWNGCTKYVLEECPFDGSHKAPDSCLLKMPSGAIAFKCLHNSCNGRTWQDVRLLYEPDAYDDKQSERDQRIEEGWKQYKAFNRNRDDITYDVIKEETDDTPMFESVKDIISKPVEERVCIKTGTTVIDDAIRGLAKGEISVVSGLRAAAKSTWLSQVMLNAVDQGFNTICYSGELKDTRFVTWLMQQAAGIENIEKSKKYEGYGTVPRKIQEQIAEWMDGKFWLYNNDFGNNFSSIATRLQKEIAKKNADLVVIDNMMILDLSEMNRDGRQDKYDMQKAFVESLKSIAMICNCHIIFVAHPRKAQGFLRLDDISGTGNIGNLVDNAFIVHRNNLDFKRLSKAMFNFNEGDPIYSGSNVIEIAKDRESGKQDVFIPLWYEQYTRRMLNYETEYKCFGWDKDNNGFIKANMDDIPF